MPHLKEFQIKQATKYVTTGLATIPFGEKHPQ